MNLGCLHIEMAAFKTKDDKQILEHFVILYDRSSAVKGVNEARLDLFAHRKTVIIYFMKLSQHC